MFSTEDCLVCALPIKSERRARSTRTDPLTWVLRTPTPLHGMRPHPQIRHGPFFAVSADMRVLQVHALSELTNEFVPLLPCSLLRMDDAIDMSIPRLYVSLRVFPVLRAGYVVRRASGHSSSCVGKGRQYNLRNTPANTIIWRFASASLACFKPCVLRLDPQPGRVLKIFYTSLSLPSYAGAAGAS